MNSKERNAVHECRNNMEFIKAIISYINNGYRCDIKSNYMVMMANDSEQIKLFLNEGGED